MWYILELTFTLLLYLLWFLIVCFCLIVRVWLNYPHSKAMWITTGITLGLIILAIVFALIDRGQSQIMGVFGGLVGCSFFVTAGIAKIIEIANASTFLPQHETLVDTVLHRSWWNIDIL